MSWGSASEWLERCELAESYLATALFDEPTDLAASDLEDAASCTAFVEGYRLGTQVGDLEPLRRRYGLEIPKAAIDALLPTHCHEAPSDEVIRGLVGYLRSVVNESPEEEFAVVIYDFFKQNYPCR